MCYCRNFRTVFYCSKILMFQSKPPLKIHHLCAYIFISSVPHELMPTSQHKLARKLTGIHNKLDRPGFCTKLDETRREGFARAW